MRSVIITCMVAGLLGAVGACSAPTIDDALATDDIPLPDRKPISAPDGGSSGGTVDSGPVKPLTLTLTVNVTGTGAITSTPAGLTCSGATCSGTFAKGSAVSLAAAPAAGSIFGGWGGACTGGAACATTLDKDVTVTADFPSVTGTWTGPYTNNRTAFGCLFNNAGTLGVTVTAAGAAFTNTATVTGLQLKTVRVSCDLVGMTTGAASASAVTIANDTLTGTWDMQVQSGGNLGFPFTAKVAGKTMTGSWTCTGCTGTFTLTKP